MGIILDLINTKINMPNFTAEVGLSEKDFNKPLKNYTAPSGNLFLVKDGKLYYTTKINVTNPKNTYKIKEKIEEKFKEDMFNYKYH